MIRSLFHNLQPVASVDPLPRSRCLCERVWFGIRRDVETWPMVCGECGRTFDAPVSAALRGTE